MTATYVGGMALDAAAPAVTIACDAGTAGIGLALPNLTERIAALEAQLAALATVPPLPSYSALKLQALQIAAAIQLAIDTPGLPVPNIASTIAALTALVTALNDAAHLIDTKLTAILHVRNLLATAGIHVVAVDGSSGTTGADLQAVIDTNIVPPPALPTHANALVLMTTDPSAWSAIGQLFKVTP